VNQRSRHLSLHVDPNTALLSVMRAGDAEPALREGAASVWAGAAGPAARPRKAPCGAGGFTGEERPLSEGHGSGREAALSARAPVNGLVLRWVFRLYDERPFLLLRLEAANRGRDRLFVDRFTPLSGRGLQGTGFLKAGWHDWVYAGFRRAGQRDVRSLLAPGSGPMHFDPALPIGRRPGEFWSSGWGVLAGAGRALAAGFVTQAEQFGQVPAACRRGLLELIAPADGVPLEPGEELASEWGYFEALELPHPEPLAGFAEAAARAMRPRVPTEAPPLTWTHWYRFFQDIDEERFLANVREIAARGASLPFRTAELDDGYQAAWGDWLECNSKFPSGLEGLAREVRARGLTPGLWLAPFVVQPGSRLEREHPEWLLRDRRGRPVGAGFFYSFFGHALDLSHPGALEHVRLLGERLRGWGFGFLKADFCYAGALPGARSDPRVTRAQALRRGLQALRAGIGEEAFLLGCGCPFGPAVGVVDAMRVGPDTAPAWHPELWSLPWTRALLRRERSVPSLRNNLRHTLVHSALHRRWWWNDPDCLLVRADPTRLTEPEVQSAVGLLGLSGGMVISSDEVARLSPERRRWLELLTPILSPGGRALDLLEGEMPELYDLPVQTEWGAWHVVLAANWADRPRRKVLELARLGLPAEEPVHVFDFWNRSYARHQGARLDLGPLEPHASRLLRLCPLGRQPAPCLVGSTLHVTQGLEIALLRAEPDREAGVRVRVELKDLGRSVEGELGVARPGGQAQAVPVRARGAFVLEAELR